MAAFLEPHLVNGETGDPALFVDLANRKRALLFDVGRCDRLAAAEVLRITDLFVTHTHIDHFIGFDELVRWHLARPTRLRVIGPPPLRRNVAGRLQGYTWNLVTADSPVVEVVELDDQGRPCRRQRFVCAQEFAPGPIEPCEGEVAVAEPEWSVRAAVCDHHDGTSVAWRLDERRRWHADPDRLAALGGTPGAWVQALKAAAAADADPATRIHTTAGPRTLGDFLEADALRPAPGDSLAYVTDVAWTPANRERLVALCAGAQVLYCEGGFLECDAAHARRVSHLTARNAGELAGRAGVGELRTFHFSRRYHPHFEPLRAEAQEAFAAAQR